MPTEKPKDWFGVTFRTEPHTIIIVAAHTLEWVKENCGPLRPERMIRRLSWWDVHTYLGCKLPEDKNQHDFALGDLEFEEAMFTAVLQP